MKSYTEKISFLRSCFGSTKVARDGVNVAVKCPACGETKGKFSINIDSWACHCWICGVKSGNLLSILRKYSEKNHVHTFEKHFGEMPKKGSNSVLEIEEPVSLPDDFVHLASRKTRDPDVKDVLLYCKSRGITERDLWYFGVGTGKSSKFRRRVIVPSFDNVGNLNYFVSRAIDDSKIPKYLNASSKKIEIVFNEMNIDWTRELTLVEGVFDLMKAGENSTCLLGSKLSKNSRLFGLIIKNRTPVLLALDQDMKVESHRIARSLSALGCRVRIFRNETENDVGSMSKPDFKKMAKASPVWTPEDRLRFKITSLKSGSIF